MLALKPTSRQKIISLRYPAHTNRYAFDRQWMFYKACGRLLYNPATPDEVFINEYEQRFPKQGSQLFHAQAKASKVPLVIASWQDGTWDFAVYSEGMLQSVMIDGKKAQKLISLEDMAKKNQWSPII